MLSLLAATLAVAAPQRPNIIYIMADDLGYRELGCYGQQKIPTPNLDQLAAQGVKMTRAYSASPVCAPTRASLLTGKHQGHAAIRGNKEFGDFTANGVEGQQPLPTSETTIAEALKSAGYRTGIVGKWGLGGPGSGSEPSDHGFDFFYGFLCQRKAHNHYPVYLWKNHQPDLLGNPMFDAHQKLDAPPPSYDGYRGTTFAATRMMEECESFIQSKDDKPFFLYYAPTLPHVALQAPQDWVEKFPPEWDPKPYLGQGGYLPTPRPRATYAAMIAYLDHTVGQIIEALEKTGKAKNTLIIFTSDNGATTAGGAGQVFFDSNGELRAGKMSLYEGGIRVPLIAKWDGRIKPGTTTDHIAVAYDSFSTLCEAAGIKPGRTDGTSYLAALEGRTQQTRPYSYFEYPEAGASQAVIWGRYKAIRQNLTKAINPIQIYDLQADPSEKNDLAGTRKDLVLEAEKIMAREHIPNPIFPLGVVDKPAKR